MKEYDVEKLLCECARDEMGWKKRERNEMIMKWLDRIEEGTVWAVVGGTVWWLLFG